MGRAERRARWEWRAAMNEQRLREMQIRMLRSYRNTGIGLLVLAPALWFFSPLGFGWWLGGLTLSIGIISVIRAGTLARNMGPPR
jgi:hypothetical protein